MTFDMKVDQRHLQMVRFVNCDTPTTSVFVAEFKSLHASLTVGVADSDQRRMDEDEQVAGSSLHVPGTLKKQKTSTVDDEADRQLENADVDDHQLAADVSSGVYTDHDAPVQSTSFTTGSNSFTIADSQEVLPKDHGLYRMVTSCGIDIHIYHGNLLHEKVDAIVNPANCHLIHSGGAARAIAEAAGEQLEKECRAYIQQHKELKVTQPMHTTAGKMYPPVKYVIHVAGPSAAQFPNPDELYKAVFDTFHHCMVHANNVLHVSSLSVPAISSGEQTGIF